MAARRRLNLLWDLDGTLTDPGEGIVRSIHYALERLGRPLASGTALGDCVGPPLRDSFARLLGAERRSRVEEAVALYRERYAARGQYENRLYPGIAECLASLTGRARMFVATAKPTGFAREIVAHFGLRRYFAAVHGSELDGTRSDKAALIAFILRREGLAPAETVMIGDRAQDVRGARRNGVAACGVAWGYGSVAELRQAGAGAIFRHPAELARQFGPRSERP